MRLVLLIVVVFLGPGCRGSLPAPSQSRNPAQRLADQGRTGEALVLLQRRSPLSQIPMFGIGRWGRFLRAWDDRLRTELLRGPLELAPVLIELEPPAPNPRHLGPRRIVRRPRDRTAASR